MTDGTDDVLERVVEQRLLPSHVDEMAQADGLGALRVPAELVDEELPGRSRARRIGETVGSFAIVALLFGVALPRLTGAHYGEVWSTLTGIGWVGFAGVAVIWLITMWCYTGVLVASLPGLRRSQALTVNFAGSAVANVVPFGGAVGVGATYAMTRSWGFTIPSITRSIVISGFWNVFAKLGIPVAALALLSFSGQANNRLVAASLIGVSLLVGMVIAFGLVLRSDRLARAVGRLTEHVASGVVGLVRRPPVTGVQDRFVAFRHDSVGLLRDHWFRLSLWMVAYTLGQFTILLLCVRFLGAGNDQVGWIEVFAAFAFNRLLTTIPLTPSGVGIAETGTVALLTAFGAATNPAAAAVLLYSAFTFLFEIPLGLVGWGVWAGNKRWRRPVATNGTPVIAPS
jgi:putative heme transporter